MPTYTIKNTMTNEVIEKFMKISEMEEFTKSGEWVTFFRDSSAPTVSSVNQFGSYTSRAMAKHGHWKDLMTNMKKNHPYMKFKD